MKAKNFLGNLMRPCRAVLAPPRKGRHETQQDPSEVPAETLRHFRTSKPFQ